MKNTLFLFLIFLLSINLLFSQSTPSPEQIEKAIEQIKILDLEENNLFSQSELYSQKEMKFALGNFTSLNEEECLVVVPMQVGRAYSEWLILMRKNSMGYWIYNDWFNLGGESIDLKDINDDGLKEIIIKSSNMNQGYFEGGFQLISLKGGESNLMYENHTFDNSSGAFISQGKVGDTISITTRVKFKDLNNDGVLELIEDKAIGIFDSYNQQADQVNQKYSKKEYIYYLKDGRYIKQKD